MYAFYNIYVHIINGLIYDNMLYIYNIYNGVLRTCNIPHLDTLNSFKFNERRDYESVVQESLPNYLQKINQNFES